MRVVSNTSPICNLAVIDRLDLIEIDRLRTQAHFFVDPKSRR